MWTIGAGKVADRQAHRAEALSDLSARMHPGDGKNIQAGYSLNYFNFNKQLPDIYNVDYSKPLGEGAYGKVWVAVHRKNRNEKVAVKGIAAQHLANFDLGVTDSREVKTMQMLDHPNIGRIFETFQDDSFLYLVMEFCHGGDLCDRLMKVIEGGGQFSVRDTALYMRQIISAVAHMHLLDVGHFDLKLDNVLLSEKFEKNPEALVKVVDFGLAQHIQRGEKRRKTAGSPYYIAPEVLNGKYDVRADNWSCGVILYIMITNKPPFNDQQSAILFEKISKAKIEIPKDVSENLQIFLKSLLQKDVHARLTARRALKHAWFQEVLGADALPKLPREILNGLETMAESHSFKRLVWREVVERTEANRVRKFQEYFRILDSGGQGFLSVHDLMTGMASLEEDPEKLKDVLETSVKKINASGQLQYSAFIAAALIGLKYKPTDEALRGTFLFFDRSGAENISVADIQRVLRFDDREHDTASIITLIDQVDADKDGRLNYKEFLAFLGIR